MFWTDGTAAGNSTQGGGTGAQGATAGASQSSTANVGNQGSGSVDLSQYVSKSDFDAINAKLTKLDADNKKYRDRLRALVSDDDEDSGKGKGKDSTSAVEEMLNLARKDRFESQITTAAVKAGAANPELVVAALSIDDVADKQGTVKNIEKVIETVKEKYPILFQAQTNPPINSGNDGSRPRNAADMNAIIRGGGRRSSRVVGAAT